MKISRDWLSDFIDFKEADPQVLAERITRAMGEVDDVVLQGKYLAKCVVGRVQSIEKHPNADKLLLVSVQTDDGTKKVVCGGTNLKENMLVAFAHIGATVKWHGGEEMTLAPVKIRGVESAGMICAAEELELTGFDPKPTDGERPIVDLSSIKAKVGTPLRKALEITDAVLHIDNHAITNRPDLFSHVGVARELVAMDLATWKKGVVKKKILFPKQQASIKMNNDIPKLIPRYAACVMEISDTGTTPLWMKKRLEAVGWRSINLPVDITNYVATELGMPLHSFDVEDLQGTVTARVTKSGEKITTLDGVERALPPGAIVLADDKGIFDLLGIMGGLRSSTKETTRKIYLHAAIVDPVSIRRTVIATGHRTDASTVYEKGVPRVKAMEGLLRAIELFLELVPGATVISRCESMGKDDVRKAVKVPIERFSSMIGMEIAPAKIKAILTNLGCAVKVAGKSFAVTPPLWRNDLTIEQEIIEEVARIIGYGNIPSQMPDACIAPPKRDPVIRKLRSALREEGCFEMLHLAFTSPAALRKADIKDAGVVRVENPLGEELSLMRPSLLPALLESIAREKRHTQSHLLKAYEYGHVWPQGKQRHELTMVVARLEGSGVSSDPTLVLKRLVHTVLGSLGHEALFLQETPAQGGLHPGKFASISIGKTTVGYIGEVHPSIRSSYDLAKEVAVATLDLEALTTLGTKIVIPSSLPKFPVVTLDETFPLQGVQGKRVAAARAASTLLRSIETIDTYEAQDTKTITLRFEYRADDRTLTQEEVDAEHRRVVSAMQGTA